MPQVSVCCIVVLLIVTHCHRVRSLQQSYSSSLIAVSIYRNTAVSSVVLCQSDVVVSRIVVPSRILQQSIAVFYLCRGTAVGSAVAA
jgi:hypothetical protein